MKPMLLVVFTAGVLVASGAMLIIGSDDDEGADQRVIVVDTGPPADSPSTTSTSTSPTSTTSTTTTTTTTEPDPTRLVPDLVGLDSFAASRLVLDEGLEFSTVEVSAESLGDVDVVVGQSPVARTSVSVGDVVEIRVARRPVPETESGVTSLFADPVDGWALAGLESGRCYNGRLVETTVEFDVVDCSAPHEMQLIVFDIAFVGPFDAEEVSDVAESRCSNVIERFIGVPLDQSALNWTWSTATEQAWNEGNRDGFCMLLAPVLGDRLIGSAEDSLW